MPPRAKKATAAAKPVDETVENQENPVTSDVARESTDAATAPEVAKVAKANDVDPTVENQENPGTSTEERPSTDEEPDAPEVAQVAKANDVDPTVENQENPGGGTYVDRHPEPVLMTDAAGITFDVSKPFPELVTDDPEADERKAKAAQTGVLDAKKIEGADDDSAEDHKHIEIEFVETGLTAHRKVWRKGQVLIMEDTEENRKSNEDTDGNVWYELSADEQKERYGKVFFEKR